MRLRCHVPFSFAEKFLSLFRCEATLALGTVVEPPRRGSGQTSRSPFAVGADLMTYQRKDQGNAPDCACTLPHSPKPV